MAYSLAWADAATSATGGFEFYSLTSGTVTSDSSVLDVGPRSVKLDTGAGATEALTRSRNVLSDAGGCVSVRFLLPSVSMSANVLVGPRIINAAQSKLIYYLAFNASSGALYLVGLKEDGSTAGITEGPTVIQANVWYTLTLAYVITSTNDNEAKFWINGNLEGSITDAAGLAVSSGYADFLIASSGGANKVLYLSSPVILTGSDLTFPGELRVTAKKPDETNTGNFDTTGGTGAVNEVPLSETNYKSHLASTDVQQNYTLQTASEGDDDLTGATIVGRTAWAWAKKVDEPGVDIALRGAAQVPGGNPTTGSTITIPATVAANDICLCAVTSRDSTGAGTLSVTDNEGAGTWTKFANSTDHKATWWWKRASANTNSKTLTVANAVGSCSFVFKAFSGCITSGDPFTDVAVETNASGDETHAGFTPTHGGSMVIASVHNIDNDNAVTSLSFATSGATTATEKTSSGGSDCGCIFGHVFQDTESPSGTGDLTWTQTDGATYSIVFALRPQTPINTSGVGADIMDNGSETAITLTSTSALYTLTTTDSNYPSNAAGIGLRSTGTSVDTYLYECGTIIAYIPAAGGGRGMPFGGGGTAFNGGRTLRGLIQ